MNLTLIIVIATLAAIFLGYFTRVNIGLYAITFAYIIGAFMMNMKTSDIILGWPVEVFFILMAVSLFYNFATVNGTMEKISGSIIYRFRSKPYLLPWVLFVVSLLLAAMGAGLYAILGLMLPLSTALSKKSNMHFMLGAVAVTSGASIGSGIINSVGGLVTAGMMMRVGVERSVAIADTMAIFVNGFFRGFVGLLIVYFILKGHKIKKLEGVEKPEPLDRQQKITLVILLIVIAMCLIPAILGLIFSDNQTIAFISSKMDISLLAIIAALACTLLKLGDPKKALRLVPWDTLIMIGGVGILINVAVVAGVIDQLASWIGANVSVSLLPLIMIIVGAAMSIFSSTYSVVIPTLFTIVPPICAATGADPFTLYMAIAAGSFATGISPFSTGGSFVLANSPSEEERNKAIPFMLFVLIPINVILCIVQMYLHLYLTF